MKVNCKYFGSVAELTGKSDELVDVPESTNLDVLDDLLKGKYPNLHFASYRLAINQEMNSGHTKLRDSDEIAFLPPFGGG